MSKTLQALVVLCAALAQGGNAFCRHQPRRAVGAGRSWRGRPLRALGGDGDGTAGGAGGDGDGLSDESVGELVGQRSFNEVVAEAFGNSSVSENPYFDVVMQIAPNELIRRFMMSSPPQVQSSVRTTILGLLGTMPQFAVETNILTTGAQLAQVMFQLQLTGYMFKNAEYRVSLSRSLDAIAALPESSELDEVIGRGDATMPTPEGKISVTMNDGQKVQVDAAAYTQELRREIESLRADLERVELEKKENKESDLLAYIKSLPEDQMRDLTASMSPEVLEAMEKLVQVVVQSMGGGELVEPNSVVQQSGSAMGQLCMWQLVIGYNLRELEVKEELRKRFTGGLSPGGEATSLPSPGDTQVFNFPMEGPELLEEEAPGSDEDADDAKQ